MNQTQIALMNLIAKVGLDSAIIITEKLATVTTAQEAVAALKQARDKTAEQYLAEARAIPLPTGS